MSETVNNQRAREALDKPQTFKGFEVAVDSAVIYNDVESADQLAAELGTTAKHSQSKYESTWKVFSVVPLPDNWDSL